MTPGDVPPNSPRPPVPNGPELVAPTRPPRRVTVVLGLWLAILLLAGLTAMLLLRGAADREPDGTITLIADPTWQDVLLTVEGPALAQPMNQAIEPWTKWRVSFFVPLGTHTVRAFQDDRLLYEEQITLDRRKPSRDIYLVSEATAQPTPATTQPAN